MKNRLVSQGPLKDTFGPGQASPLNQVNIEEFLIKQVLDAFDPVGLLQTWICIELIPQIWRFTMER